MIKTSPEEKPEAIKMKRKIRQLEFALKRKLNKWIKSQEERGLKDHEIAKSLGYDLCDCTEPPQIMLFKRILNANVCPACESAVAKVM